jgi:glucose uptake protein
MLLPHSYQAALFLMILSMLCWGSWANTLKLCPGFRFQLFYWDYAIGLAAGAVFWGLTAGSMGHAGPAFLSDAAQTPLACILYAACGGVIFNVANLLLVAAIDVAGMAVAFPVGIGLALIVGAVSSYLVSPAGNPLLLFGGVALVTVAIILDALAYKRREASAKAATTRGIVLSLVAGVLMGCFYPL